MSQIINLNRARKAKARSEADATAAENRVKFGRTKSQRTAEAVRAAKAKRALDDVKRDP